MPAHTKTTVCSFFVVLLSLSGLAIPVPESNSLNLLDTKVLDNALVQRICIGNQGDLLALETRYHRIAHYDVQGHFVGQIGSIGQHTGEFYYPDDMALDRAGNIYVLEPDNRRVQGITAKGQFFTSFHIEHQANSIAVDNVGHIFLGDPYANNLVSEYDKNGKLIRLFGNMLSFSSVYGIKHLSLNHTYSRAINRIIMTVGPDNHLYVAFIGAPILQQYTLEGILVHEWRYPEALSNEITGTIGATMTVPSSEKFTDDKVPIPSIATGIAFDPKDNCLWVSVNWKKSYLLSFRAPQMNLPETFSLSDTHIRLSRIVVAPTAEQFLALSVGYTSATKVLFIQKPNLNSTQPSRR